MFVNQAKIASILPHYTLKIVGIFPNNGFYLFLPYLFIGWKDRKNRKA
ncbi:hypothetical protein kam1_1536 [Methylacidiphilum kamchatkense Kam1]|uniref:Uncharacterized protein n=1 Tax=Methylacidiphilum kamchatkense Kam1 TaxID=1202785 RepID=A0A516TNF3_9BACT|nr:hypothetical protein kam1_1536 [Methylacidiphilum kamchatkense Kam1]